MDALYNNTGNYNTASGAYALNSNTTGYLNTASGVQALTSNTTGYNNTASGTDALFANTTGNDNTASGTDALFANTTGYNNTASGADALNYNTTGYNNTASGMSALYSNTTGFLNTASGADALQYNTTGSSNTASGVDALTLNTTGFSNTASGAGALHTNTTGYFNMASGAGALQYNTTGTYNTASGAYALFSNTTGYANTASGTDALYSNTTGSYNTGVGYAANVSSSALNNATAIGYGAVVNASNKIRFGNSAVTVIEGNVAYTVSDVRFKTNIIEDVKGLSFINKLRPVVYNLQARKFDEFLMKNMRKEKRDSILNNLDYREAENIRRSGFIAQEVEKAAKETGYDFDAVHVPENDDDNYSLSYAEFVVPLVKAVQELSNMNDNKEKEIDSLKEQLTELKTLVLSIQQIQQQCNACNNAANGIATNSKAILTDEAMLAQNIPNPFSNTTLINYTLPQKYTQAYIVIINKAGKILKQINISGSGKGSLTADASLLSSGAYTYSMYIDGKLIDTKQMEYLK